MIMLCGNYSSVGLCGPRRPRGRNNYSFSRIGTTRAGSPVIGERSIIAVLISDEKGMTRLRNSVPAMSRSL